MRWGRQSDALPWWREWLWRGPLTLFAACFVAMMGWSWAYETLRELGTTPDELAAAAGGHGLLISADAAIGVTLGGLTVVASVVAWWLGRQIRSESSPS